jgi:hypothetical protein
MMRFAALLMSAASLLFLTWTVHWLGLEEQNAIFFILTADAVIFPAGFLASGILDGLAFICAEQQGWFTFPNFLLADVFLRGAFARSAGPTIGRWAVDRFGQNAYALMQFVLTAFGLLICFQVPKSQPTSGEVESGVGAVPVKALKVEPNSKKRTLAAKLEHYFNI